MTANDRGAQLPSKRICIVLLSGIGDVVHGLPIVNALKRDDPERHITWVVESPGAPLLRPHPAVDEVLTFDRKRGLPDVIALWRKLRHKKFDLLLNLNIYFKAAVVSIVARAPNKVSFGRDRARDPVWLFANHQLPVRYGPHTQDRFCEFLHFIGIGVEPMEWRILLSEQEKEAQREFFQAFDSDRPVVGIVPTSGRDRKDWSTDRFAEVAAALTHDFGCQVVLLGGPAEHEVARGREVEGLADAELTWALGGDLRRLIYIIDGCDLIISPDTGPLHVARAMETPVIGIYGHTDPMWYGPYRAYEDLIIDRYRFDAPGVLTDDARHLGRDGRMRLVTAADVLEKVELAMQRYVARGGDRKAGA